jgi:hypothetical protein
MSRRIAEKRPGENRPIASYCNADVTVDPTGLRADALFRASGSVCERYARAGIISLDVHIADN